MTVALANCKQCGKLFAKMYHDICPACMEKMEQDYETVYYFLKENGPSHIDVIHKETGVEKKIIMQFLAEGRFEGASISYKCESCGEAITSGKLCEKCAKSISKQIEKIQQEKAPSQNRGAGRAAYLRETSLDRYMRKK